MIGGDILVNYSKYFPPAVRGDGGAGGDGGAPAQSDGHWLNDEA